MRIIISFFSVLFFFFLFNPHVSAQDKATLPAITIINPIRGNELGLEKIDLLSSLKAQWKVTDGLPATWLWQYSALENDKLVDFAKTEMKGQEFGLFLEVDRNFAQKSGVQYRGQGPWYFSDGIFLISYDLEERKKIIDEIFSVFKKQFGYYPKTVGAWWIGADSLTYMQQKYGIVAALKAADQYDLDVYSLLGSPWSIPYVASKDNEGIPAKKDNTSQVVILQWAARDPTDGYKDATYSVQDFHLKSYDFSYFDYLSSVFLQKPMDNLVIGLENGGNLEGLQAGYGKYIQKAKELQQTDKVDILLAKDYAQNFLAQKTTYSDNHYFLTKAYKSENESFWYNSENYRAGIFKQGNNIYLIDLKDYSKKVTEEFAVLPNSQGYLRTTAPSVVDSMRNPSEKILIASSTDALSFEEKDNGVTLLSGNKKIAQFTNSSLELFKNSNTSQVFQFRPQTFFVSLFSVLSGIFFLYFIAILVKTKNLKTALFTFTPLLIPLLLAHPFLTGGITFDQQTLFDRKQLWLLSLLPFFSSAQVAYLLQVVQILPLCILLVSHAVLLLIKSGRWQKVTYYVLYGCVILAYAHVPYFPFDRSTYPVIAVSLLVVTAIGIGVSFVILRTTQVKKLFFFSLVSIPFILAIIVSILYVSRTRLIVTPFEVEALQEIKDKKKDVVFVSQTNYGVRPIYKAVKPLLFENYQFGESMTSTQWEIVEKSEKSVVDVSRYVDKLIVVPRYLGADFSEDEMKKSSFKKVFDNGQIAMFEKE